MAKIIKEIQFSLPNKVGGLKEITDALKAEKVNILHMVAWVEEKQAFVNLVTDNNSGAKKALEKLGISTSEKELLEVMLENKVGSLNEVAAKLSKAGIDITCLSATSAGAKVAVLLHTDNNAKAATLV